MWCALATALLLGTAGCTGNPGAGTAGTESGSQSEEATTAAAPTSETTTAPAAPITTSEPCPYLTQAFIELTVGQRIPRVETITVEGQPAPDCIFYRNDDTASVAIDLTPYPDPIAAQNAALALITPAAMPITDIGEYGGVLVTATQTLLAVTSGPLLIYIVTNQPSSLQARTIATTALAGLPPA